MKNTTHLLAMLTTSLIITACSGSSSSLSATECGEPGAGDDRCTKSQPDSTIVFLKSRRYGGQYCGDRIKADEVLIIDIQTAEGKSLLEQAGPYVLLTESPIGIESRGSLVQTIRAATDSAASRGCNLLLTGPIQTSSLRTDSTGSSNPSGNYDISNRLERYMLVRMAKLQE